MAAISGERPLEGEALERTSFSSLFTKEWNNTYWVLQGNMLLLFPNKEAYIRNPTQGRKTFKLTAHMHVKDVAEKAYKGYGTLFKFALEEEIDHGKSVVARFATYKAEDAHFFCDNVKSVLRLLRAEIGIHEEEEELDDGDEEETPAPAHGKKQHGAQKMWGGMDG